MPTQPDETRLLAAAREGDRAAREMLIRRYEATVAKTVIGMLGPGPDAEDAGQEAMIRFLQGIDSFKGGSSLRTYVTRIAMNVALDALRRRKRLLERFRAAVMPNRADTFEEFPDDADHAAALEARQLVSKALAGLKPPFRSVVVLRELHGYTTDEVAGIMNIAHGTVLSRLARGKAQLAAALRGCLRND